MLENAQSVNLGGKIDREINKEGERERTKDTRTPLLPVQIVLCK
jgi:hypothetical protein